MKTLRETIVIGSDHAGFPMKELIKNELAKRKYDVRDVGAYTGEEPSDYPFYVAKVAHAVSMGHFARGIAIDGTGVGASVVANRFPKVRATLCNDIAVAKLARAHTDSNVLVLAGRLTPEWLASQILDAWLTTSFEGGRHVRRVKLIDDNTQLHIALSHLGQINLRRIEAEAVNQPFMERTIKGLEKLSRLFGTDRRRETETARATESSTARLEIEGKRHRALMLDLSRRGAQFRIQDEGELSEVMVDDGVQCSVKTPYGTAECAAVVKWVDLQSNTIGVVFRDFDSDSAEPLRSLLESEL
ncbi:MAG: ribose 5-phosphate isomerase B [Chitinivibrionales bacterium]|nr:ribose 5-phosphate isomerase B [Chitinivibrionales bacterium]